MTNRLLLAALTGLAPHIDMLDEAQTFANPKRYRYPSEIDIEKKTAKQREIAEWNAKVEAKKK